MVAIIKFVYMCYDIKTTLETQLKRAKRRNDLQAIDEIMESLIPYTDLPLFHASGFAHPEVLIYINDAQDFPIVASWGLVPSWITNEHRMKQHQNFTINARIESIFEKASFKDVINKQRCILYIDGFYEHHHYKGKTYPFYITRTDQQYIAIAGIWNEWINPDNGGRMNTFSIVTTKGNALMKKIHNNPKLKEPRMPLILNEADEDLWLEVTKDNAESPKIQSLIQSSFKVQLAAHPVGRLRGRAYKGNIQSVSDVYNYEDLVF